MQITTAMLIEKDACQERIEEFRQLFGEGGEVTEEKVMQAAEAYLPFSWIATRFFPREAAEAYSIIRAEVYQIWQESTLQFRNDAVNEVTTYSACQVSCEPYTKIYYRALGEAFWKIINEYRLA